MKQLEKVKQLADRIASTIIPLIDGKYVLYGLPYYTNVGDTLIWEGELEILKKIPYRCVGTCGWSEYPTKPVPEDTIILITGGGYFGDVWRNAWEHVLEGIKHNKQNKIIMLPCSVYYEDEKLREQDAEYLAQFKNFIICARDQFSYDYAKKYFSNEVILVPDMAFAINLKYLNQWVVPSTDKTLFLRRIDKEYVEQDVDIPDDNVVTSDWPTMDGQIRTSADRWFIRVLWRIEAMPHKYPSLTGLSVYLKNWLYKTFHRKMMTSRGVEFVSSYKKIYTTRLHVMILSILLGKEVYFIDNSYKKISALYNTWLIDCDNVYNYIK
jgi:pyruvyl transferase EpsO